jgi:8-oxo-dGTP pyrophosphatase MutT (NUDIX family)
MPVPEFVRELRRHVGHAPLSLTGVVAVILDDQGRILLTHRADTRRWALLGGILEPGEQPADAVVREALEETGVRVLPERLAAVMAYDELTVYPNGDQARYLALLFRCRHLGGEAKVNDDESLDVRWFPLDELPDDVTADEREKIRLCLADTDRTWFALSAITPGVS